MLVSSVDTSQFLFHVDKRLYEGNELTSKFLDSSTKRPLLEIIECYLLKPHLATLLEKGFKLLMDENRKDDLKRMFLLFERVKALDLLKTGWAMYIR
jgi:cullin-4